MNDPQSESADAPTPTPDDYALAAEDPILSDTSYPVLRDTVAERYAEIRRQVAPRPPRWPFFEGVFTFPWRSEKAQRWAYGFMTAGFSILILLGLFIEGLSTKYSGVGAGMLLVFLLSPMLIVVILTVAYTAACCLRVLEVTAAGEDTVAGWPDNHWRDWLAHLAYLSWIGVIPLALAYGIGLIARHWGVPLRWTGPVALFALYPIALMSALDADSIWMPFTWPVFRSLFREAWAWLMFYALSGLFVFGLAITTIGSLYSSPHSVLICLGPLLPGVLLIYFRLFGRLAWRLALGSSNSDDTADDPEEDE